MNDTMQQSRPTSDSIMTLDITEGGGTSARQYPSGTELVTQAQLEGIFANSGLVPFTTGPGITFFGTQPPTKEVRVDSTLGISTKGSGSPEQRQTFERSAPGEWDSIRIQCDGKQEVWYIRAIICYQTALGLTFKLFLHWRKGEARMEWKHGAGTEHPALFRDAVASKKKFKSFKMSSCDKSLLLETLQRYCGQKWVAWRKDRADWVAGGGIERSKAARRRHRNKSRAR